MAQMATNMFILTILVNICGLLGAFELKNNRHARIFGGQNWTQSNPLNPSFMVSIYEFIGEDEDMKCAGSFIGPSTVLTAAECCERYNNVGVLSVHFGGTVLNQQRQMRYVSNILIHPKYNSNNQAYGFCIMTLEDPPVNKSSTVNFIEIATCTPLNGTSVRMAGWGQTNRSVPLSTSQQLKVLDMKILSSRECKFKFHPDSPTYSISNESQICATSSNGSACYGDQGAPLVYDGKLVGVEVRLRRNSYTIICPKDANTEPNVFGDTVKVRDWILDNIK